jgi:Circadian oscillating protein COP23
MKNILLTIAIIGSLTTIYSLRSGDAIAQTPTKVRFYCGQTFDPNSNQIVPTTLVATSAKQEPIALIQWKSKLNGKYTPQVRCNMVSSKFQQAWETKRLTYLTAGVAKSGAGLICGIKSRATPCNESTMLFTLLNGADATETIDRIKNIRSGTGSNPLPQSSGNEVVEVESIFN